MEYKAKKAILRPVAENKILTTFGEALESPDPVRALYISTVDLSGSEEDALATLSLQAQVIYLVQLFDLEMLNGGLDQFFCNPSGNYATETAEALQSISAKKSLSILNRAIEIFPRDLLTAAKHCEREQFVSDRRDEYATNQIFDTLDNEYYDTVHSFPAEPIEPENLWHLCQAFIKTNSSCSVGVMS